MKKVAIFTRITNYNNKEIFYIPKAVYDKICGRVDVIIVPFKENESYTNKLDVIKLVDGVILPGGDDIYDFEIELVKYLYEKDIPTLGICLGMQTMGCALNGKLGKLSDSKHKNTSEYVHNIKIDKNSLLFKIIKKAEIQVNSRHQDYLMDTSLNIGAKCENVIEEVEDIDKKFFIGVQWHPENLNDDNSDKLFNYFIKKL